MEVDYVRLLSQYFVVAQCLDIEDLIIDVNNRTEANIIGVEEVKRRRIADIFDDELLGKILIKALELIGFPRHDFNAVGRSLFRHKLFVLKKEASPPRL